MELKGDLEIMTRVAQVAYDVLLDAIECCECGMVFAMPHAVKLRLRRSHALFYCPAGHPQYFSGESDEERLHKELAQAERRVKEWQSEYDQEWKAHKATERRLSATKGVLTRTKKRIAHGVCPCCNRTFANLARHMGGQHPDYEAEHSV
jgi:hypothetical protein